MIGFILIVGFGCVLAQLSIITNEIMNAQK